MRPGRRLAALLVAAAGAVAVAAVAPIAGCGDSPAAPGGPGLDLTHASVVDAAPPVDLAPTADLAPPPPDTTVLADLVVVADLTLVCNDPQLAQKCGATCVDPQGDPANCGGCGVICPPGFVCALATCRPQCPKGAVPCGNACANLHVDPANCGACGHVCAPGEVCTSDACSTFCPAGLTACKQGGPCTDLEADAANCGQCGHVCPQGFNCVAHLCTVGCQKSLTACGDTCANLQTDPAHCGDCATACDAGKHCVAGACVVTCGKPLVACAMACVDARFDPANCGACGVVCPAAAHAVAVCESGACGVACSGTFRACLNGDPAKGCETDVATDPKSCGTCGAACPVAHDTPGCVAGACTVAACDPGYGDCDHVVGNGCETSLLTDGASCGACGHACKTNETCQAGVCQRYRFHASQTVDGKTVLCAATSVTDTYTECDGLTVDGLSFANGLNCGPAWTFSNPGYTDVIGFCAALTGTAHAESYLACDATQKRATWMSHVFGTTNDNGFVPNIRCYY